MSVFMAAGIVLTLVAGAADAKNQRETGKANQAIEENRAKLANEQARDEAQRGSQESQKSAWRMRALQGQQRAAIAASGVDGNVGSAADILDETAMLGAADRKNVGKNAERSAWGFNMEALNSRNAGAQARWQGKVGSQTTILKSFGSAFSQGASMARG